MDLGTIAGKIDSEFTKTQALLKPHHQSVLSGTLVGAVLLLYRDADSVFCSPQLTGLLDDNVCRNLHEL